MSLHGLDNSRACFSIWIEILKSPFIWCTFIAYDEFFLIDMKVKFWCNFLRLYQELVIRKTSVLPTRILTEKFNEFCFCDKNPNWKNWKIKENNLHRPLLSVQNFAQITRCHWKSFNNYCSICWINWNQKQKMKPKKIFGVNENWTIFLYTLNLIKDPKRFWDVCNTNDVQGLRRFQNLDFKKMLTEISAPKIKVW